MTALWIGLAGFVPAVLADEAAGIPWWVWILPVVFLIFLLWGVTMRSQGQGVVRPEKALASAAEERHTQPKVPEAVVEAPAPVVAKVDDLEIIEGIGPKIASLLKAAGITTFTGLAEQTPDAIRAILKSANLRVPADPTTWPDQARLAAQGSWEDLKKLQDSLKAGRLV